MRVYQLLALLAVSASAIPQDTKGALVEASLGPPASVPDGLDVDPGFIGKTVLDITPDASKPAGRRELISTRDVSKQQASPPDSKLRSAEEVSKIKAPGGGKTGLFYRGDSRPPSEIFASGFAPQGHIANLQHHLDFKSDSGLVSLSRSPESARRYAFGRSADKNQKGYVYVIAAKDVPDGYWVPGIYSPDKNPSVRINQEFAVAGSVPSSSISHAYEMTREKNAKSRKMMNKNYSLRSAASCTLLRKRAAVCDPARWTNEITRRC